MSYFDNLIEAHLRGHVSDHVHLGLFRDTGQVQTLDVAQIAMVLHHLSHIKLTDGASFIDIGCGFGGTLRLIDRKLNNATLTGVNIDPRQIKISSSGQWRNPVNWLLCDAANFSKGRAEWADGILSLEALFHFPNPSGFFAECAKALRPDGKMVISTILLSPKSNSSSIETICNGFQPWPFPYMTLCDLYDMSNNAELEIFHHENLAPFCLPSFDWMSSPCPSNRTENPIIELRRLFEAKHASYQMLVLGLRRRFTS